MKKFLMSVSMVTAMCVVMSSCLKNDNSSYVAPVDPAVEAPALQAFIDSTHYNFVTDADSLHFYAYDQTSNKYVLKGYKAPYLYYQIVDAGDQSEATKEVSDKLLGGNKGINVTVYNKVTDSTLIFSVSYTATLLNGTVVDKTDDGAAYLQAFPNVILAWQLLLSKVGSGGHIRILTPSLYGYANSKQGTIPANTPLYFDITVNGYVNNSYINK